MDQSKHIVSTGHLSHAADNAASELTGMLSSHIQKPNHNCIFFKWKWKHGTKDQFSPTNRTTSVQIPPQLVQKLYKCVQLTTFQKVTLLKHCLRKQLFINN